MKLASLKSGRDGRLVVVSRDLKRYQERYEQVFDRPMRSRLTIVN